MKHPEIWGRETIGETEETVGILTNESIDDTTMPRANTDGLGNH